MKLARPDVGFDYADDPILPAGFIGVDPGTRSLRVGDGASAWSTLPEYRDTPGGLFMVVNALSEIPAGTPPGRLVVVKGAAQAAVLYRRNLAKDPKATSVASFVQSGGALSAITDWRTSAVRWTRTATGSARINLLAPSLTLGAVHSIRMKVRASSPFPGSLIYRPAGASNSTGQAEFGATTIPAGESEVVVHGVALTSQPNANGSFALTSTSGAVGQTVDVTDVQIEQAATVGEFFYGGSPSAGADVFEWEGDVNASVSRWSRTPYAASLYFW